MNNATEDAPDPDDQEASTRGPGLLSSPRALALSVAVFTLLIGLPAGLFLWRGQVRVAAGLTIAFLALLGVSAYVMRVATRELRASRED